MSKSLSSIIPLTLAATIVSSPIPSDKSSVPNNQANNQVKIQATPSSAVSSTALATASIPNANVAITTPLPTSTIRPTIATLQASAVAPASTTTIVSTQVPLTIQVSHPQDKPVAASAPVSLEQVGDELKEAVKESPSISQIAVKFLKNFINYVPYFLVAILIFICFWLLSKLYNIVLKKILGDDKKYQHNFPLVIRLLGSSFIMLVGFVFALVVALPGLTATKLLGALGFGSVVLGFAFKDTFQNLLSGILMLINEPFKIGDQIVVNNYEGTVENVHMHATTICTYDNRRIVIPNAEIYKLAVTVNTAYETRRLYLDVGIGYSEDIDNAENVIQQALKKCKTIDDKKSPIVVATEFGDSAINLRIL